MLFLRHRPAELSHPLREPDVRIRYDLRHAPTREAELQDVLERDPRLEMIGDVGVEFGIALVPQNVAIVGIEHANRLRKHFDHGPKTTFGVPRGTLRARVAIEPFDPNRRRPVRTGVRRHPDLAWPPAPAPVPGRRDFPGRPPFG